MSQTVKNLEDILEVRLFDRTTRKVTLTEAGVTLLPRVLELTDQLDRAINDAQLAARGETGKVTIGVSGGATESRLPRVFASFRRRFPKIRLNVRLLGSGPQIEAVLREEIDAGFAISPIPRPGLFVDVLRSTGFVLQIPQSLAIQKKRMHDLSHYRDQDFISLTNAISPGYAARCQALFQEAGFSPRFVRYADDPHTIMTLVSAGVGISIIPKLMQGIRRAGVKHIPLRSKNQVELAMIYRSGDERTSLASIREIARKIFGWEQAVPR